MPSHRRRPFHRTSRPWRAVAAGVLALLAGCGGGGSEGPGPDVPPGSTPPATGLFVTAQYTDAQLVVTRDIEYSRRPNEGGVQYTSERSKADELGRPELSLELDIAVPPNATLATPAPAVVWVHGGGYVGGAKEDAYDKLLTYARAGYVAVTINYRLTPDNDRTPQVRQRAIVQATEDAMNAIRFLKVNAAAYRLDPDRIAAIGGSAGGGIVLINAVEYDTLAGTQSDHPGVSSRVQAAISTGATLFDALGASYPFGFDAADTPVLLFHANATDSVTGATWSAAVLPTQQAIEASGNSCQIVAQPDMTHTVDLSLGGKWWEPIKTLLWTRLRLAELH